MPSHDPVTYPDRLPFRTYLYVSPADEAAVRAAYESDADAVVLDLEDLTPVADKPRARAVATAVLDGGPRLPTLVRINASSSDDEVAADLDAVVRGGLTAVRLPKSEDPQRIHDLAAEIEARRVERGLVATIGLQVMVETSRGIEQLPWLARATHTVWSLGIGEGDLKAELGTAADVGLAHARSSVVIAARSAHLPAPVQVAFPASGSIEDLRANTELGRALGFGGRSLIAPAHVAVVHDIYEPHRVLVGGHPMSAVVNVSLAPAAWARRSSADLLDVLRALDASLVTSVALADPDEAPDARTAAGPWRWDTTTGVGAGLAVTTRVGLVVSVATSYTEPFTASRRVGSLDNLSDGRVGWLVDPRRSAALDRRTRAVSPPVDGDPVERAVELADISRELWDSWDEGALRLDVAGNELVDLTKVRRIDARGRYFSVAGPINLRRPPSGNPPAFVRVSDGVDATLAGRIADVALVADGELAGAVRDAAADHARHPVLLQTIPAGEAIPAVGRPGAGELDGWDIAVATEHELDTLVGAVAGTVPPPTSTPGLRGALALPLLRS